MSRAARDDALTRAVDEAGARLASLPDGSLGPARLAGALALWLTADSRDAAEAESVDADLAALAATLGDCPDADLACLCALSVVFARRRAGAWAGDRARADLESTWARLLAETQRGRLDALRAAAIALILAAAAGDGPTSCAARLGELERQTLAAADEPTLGDVFADVLAVHANCCGATPSADTGWRGAVDTALALARHCVAC